MLKTLKSRRGRGAACATTGGRGHLKVTFTHWEFCGNPPGTLMQQGCDDESNRKLPKVFSITYSTSFAAPKFTMAPC